MRVAVGGAAAALSAAFLLACASATPIEGLSGKRRYLIRCDGLGVSISACLARARQECPLGYRLVQVSGRTPDPGGAVWSEPGAAGELPAASGRYVVAECEGEG